MPSLPQKSLSNFESIAVWAAASTLPTGKRFQAENAFDAMIVGVTPPKERMTAKTGEQGHSFAHFPRDKTDERSHKNHGLVI